jgi:hypothetical protein
MSRVNLKQIIAASAVVLMWGCASRGVRCDGQLQPINSPVTKSAIDAMPESPEVEVEAPDQSEARDE